MFCFGAGRNICVLLNARKLPILFVLHINRRQDILLNSFKTKIKKFPMENSRTYFIAVHTNGSITLVVLCIYEIGRNPLKV